MRSASLIVLLINAFYSGFGYGDIMPPPEPSPVPQEGKQVIESFHVRTDIRYRFATTEMCSVVRNTGSDAREMTFDVTLPKEAFITSFAMTIDGKVYDGEVKEKGAAKKQYNQAVERGQSAGHIRQTPRHSNRFDVSVNVAGYQAVNFTLTYQQVLSRKLGLYEYEMHVEPGQAVQDFKVEVFIQENRPLLFVKTPQLRKASVITNEIEASNDLTVVDRPSETTAHIRYKPSVAQQGTEGIAARFVVQYDVEHSDNGDLLVADGYFLHLFAPKPAPPLPKDIIFVLDTSGSMSGTKMAQLKDAMKTILGDLTEEDRFNILPFSSKVSKWKSVLTKPTPAVISEATHFMKYMKANGGTNINSALLTALGELQGRESRSRVGMIFFLTDGEATEGETNTNKIAANVMKKNLDTAIFSLAFGDGANFESLKTISSQNDGFARKIYEASDAALQVASLYEEISAVSMKNVSVSYLPSITKTTETDIPVVFNGTEIMIGGCIDLRWVKGAKELKFRADLMAIDKKGDVDIVLEYDDIDEVTLDTDDSLNPFFSVPRDYGGIIEKIWAFLTIKQMLKEKDSVDDKQQKEALGKKVLEMSLKYKFVTPLTSMVVTKPDTDSPVESGLEDVDNLPTARRSQPTMLSSGNFNHQSISGSHPVYAYASVPARSGAGPQGRRGHNYRTKSRRRQYSGHRVRQHSGPLDTVNSLVVDADASSTQTSSTRTTRPIRRRKNGGKRRNKKGKGKGKQPKFGILRTLVFKTDQESMCLAPKKLLSGKYLLLESANNFKIELSTTCLKNCRLVVPGQLILSSGGKTSAVNLTSLTTWEFQQHPDFDVTFVKLNEMVLDNPGVVISITRTRGGKKMFYSIMLTVDSRTGVSGLIDFMQMSQKARKKRLRRPARGCKNVAADISLVLMKKRAIKYKI